MSNKIPGTFRDSNYKPIPYDGSPVEWRVSIYGCWIKNGQVMLVKNQGEEFWDLPGGGVEIHETIIEALRRESKEEAGCELELTELLDSDQDWFYHTKAKKFYRSLQLFGFAKPITGLGTPTDPRVLEAKFIDWAEAKNLLYPHVVQLLEPYLKNML